MGKFNCVVNAKTRHISDMKLVSNWITIYVFYVINHKGYFVITMYLCIVVPKGFNIVFTFTIRTKYLLCVVFKWFEYMVWVTNKGNWLLHFKDKFGWTKTNLLILERRLKLRPPDWRAGELSSPTLAVSLFCQYLCSGSASQKSRNHILPFSQGSRKVLIKRHTSDFVGPLNIIFLFRGLIR